MNVKTMSIASNQQKHEKINVTLNKVLYLSLFKGCHICTILCQQFISYTETECTNSTLLDTDATWRAQCTALVPRAASDANAW